MQEEIVALNLAFQGSNHLYFWLFFYFGLGSTMFSSVIVLVYFAKIVSTRVLHREWTPLKGQLFILFVSTFSWASLFTVLTIFRAIKHSNIAVPEIATLAAIAGAVLQVLVHIILNKHDIGPFKKE